MTEEYYMNIFLTNVIDEYRKARQNFPKFNSAHEGYAVIKEEFDELWDEIKASPDSRTITRRIIEETIQTAAMLMALVLDLEFAEND